jgi:hypothetical protein
MSGTHRGEFDIYVLCKKLGQLTKMGNKGPATSNQLEDFQVIKAAISVP